MLTLEQLNKLRGITPDKTPSQTTQAPTTETTTGVATTVQSDIFADNIQQSAFSVANNQSEPATSNTQPVEIPCKNYTDEEGHFAYIDAQTKQTIHVNLNSGNIYTQEEINSLSIKKATSVLSDEAKRLIWQQVVTQNTLYDQFGSPVFTYEEIQDAIKRVHEAKNQAISPTDNNNATNNSNLDAWGLPK